MIYIYNEELLKYSTIELSNNINQNERSFNENNNLLSKKYTITSKYLINIFNTKNEDSTIIYYAYVVIIDMKKIMKNKEIMMGGNDIRENNEFNNTIPVVNISFSENGILNVKINEKMDKTLVSYLYEFVEQVIINESSINETNKYEKKDDDKIIIYKDLNNSLNDDEYEEEQSYKVEINKKKVKNVISKKVFSLSVNNDITLGDENSSNFTKDIEHYQKKIFR